MNQEQQDILDEIFTEALQLGDGEDIASLTMDNTAQWDSMALVRIVTGMEDEFDFQIDVAEALKLKSYQKCCEFLQKKLR